jgi:predicted O-methyltransferase YrrM
MRKRRPVTPTHRRELEDRWNAVERYLVDTIVQPDSALNAALESSATAGLPAINVSPNAGKLLLLLAMSQKARQILEIGTLGAYSTIWLARALPPDGRLITLESNAEFAEVARANIKRAGLSQVVDVRVGTALDTLPRLASEGLGPFDLIFIDADKPNTPEYFAWALKLSRRGSLIIVDNVVRDGEIANAASADASVQAMRRLNELLADEPRVTATVLQTVGSKGYDGFAIALVVAD